MTNLTPRQQAVMDVLQDMQWHDGHELTRPDVGGSEGLRRLREIRDMGTDIRKRKKPVKGSTTWQYRIASMGTLVEEDYPASAWDISNDYGPR